MSHILFVERRLRTDKLGMLYLAASLEAAGHTIALVQDEIDSADDYLARVPTNFVMYSVTTGDHHWYLQRNQALKSRHRFTAVMGGPHFTFFPEQGVADPTIDFVVQGPAEDCIVDLVEGRITERLVRGHLPCDVNALPPPARAMLYRYPEFGQARMKRFIAGRDCRYACRYCFNHLLHRLYADEKERFFQRTSPSRIIDEILGVKKRWSLELVYFNDDDLAGDHDWLHAFCQEYNHRVGLPFCGSIRASSVSYELLAEMASAGCTFLNIALESGDPDTRRLIGRTGITEEQVRAACADCHELGIKVRLQNMIGLPVTDPLDDALTTLRVNQEIAPTDSWVAIYQPLPKTDLGEYCIKQRLITTETECANFYDSTPLAIPHRAKIDRLHKWWFFIVRHQLPPPVVDVLLDMPLRDEQAEKLQQYRWQEASALLYGMKGV